MTPTENPPVLETQARVLAVTPGLALVEIRRRSGCGACSLASGCATAALAELFGPGRHRVAVSDGIGVAAGDQVVIGVAAGALTRASMLAYLLPLLALILTSFLAQAAGAGEAAGALAGLLGLGAGMLGTAAIARAAPEQEIYRPRLLRRSGGPTDFLPACPAPERGVENDPSQSHHRR